jgi:hypothetical protein
MPFVQGWDWQIARWHARAACWWLVEVRLVPASDRAAGFCGKLSMLYEFAAAVRATAVGYGYTARCVHGSMNWPASQVSMKWA